MKPYDVTDADQLLEMESDNHPSGHEEWSILHSGDEISLHDPKGGYVVIPRDQFNVIVDWYMADQKKLKQPNPL